MTDLIGMICFFGLSIFGLQILAKIERENFEKKLKNDIEIAKMIIEEFKK